MITGLRYYLKSYSSLPQVDDRDADIADPWEGPETYAEDYYAGGNIPSNPSHITNPHVLPNEVEDDDDQQDEEGQSRHIPIQ